jgi:ABC-type multidrug transport system ATPase subunit
MLGLSKKLLLLDEPAAELDEPGIEDIRKIVTSERDTKRILFIATHHLIDFLDLATHVAALESGRLKYFVTTNEYILEKVRVEDLGLREKLIVHYYRNFGRFPGDEELLSYWRGEFNC